MVVLLSRLIVFPCHTHCVYDPISLQELSRSPLPCGHSPSRPRIRHPLHCYTVPRVIHLSLPRFSHTGRTTHHVHDPNSLQELSWSPLPCGHSPSRPRLRHPLHCYTVPRVIHLSLPRFSRTGRISETLSSLTVEVSLRLSLSRHPSSLCYLNTTYSRRSWLITGFSWLNSSHFSFPFSSSVLSGQIFSFRLNSKVRDEGYSPSPDIVIVGIGYSPSLWHHNR
jgi:hypothetical protein